MNDNELKQHMNREDPFDNFLRQQLHSNYIDDNGFAAQVMASLPAQKPLKPWLEKALIALPVAIIAFLVLRHLPWRDLVQPVYAWFLLLDMTSLISIAIAIFFALVVAPVAWILNSDS
ncbi:hypothetical protein [Cellvibrio fontiphilus]|uniref:Uncharacterized protein n=1 Tax=Cellvibrio fontiphilus TaxID=1815559 RepID=A0ABV7FHA8_9GAMM